MLQMKTQVFVIFLHQEKSFSVSKLDFYCKKYTQNVLFVQRLQHWSQPQRGSLVCQFDTSASSVWRHALKHEALL